MAIQMNVSGLRRNLKNIAHNYTDAQVKVREATSNDPWGPSSTLMSEIADLTYNVVAFSEIMQMVWKRLNDHGRNWRHVYKALVLLEYLIKTGSEKVADQCKENIYTIQTLKDFQYLEENKDMGINVREKAKTLVSLLKDDERLRNERVRALKSKERIAQTVSAMGSDSSSRDKANAEELTITCDGGKDINSPTSPSYPDTFVTSSARADRPSSYGVSGLTRRSSSSELENARPQTVGEEELQLQLALAMSKEEADQEEAKKKSDDVRLQMALSQSETDYSPQRGSRSLMEPRDRGQDKEEKSALSDLLDINFNPNGQAAAAAASSLPSDPWGIPVASGASSGSLSPLNLTQPPKTLIDFFEDYGDFNESTTPRLSKVVGPADPWGMTPPVRELSTPKQGDPWASPSSAPSSRVTSPPTTNDPWAPPPPPPPPKSPEVSKSGDPWSPMPAKPDPWTAISSTTPIPAADPFAPIADGNTDEFSAISKRDQSDNDMMFDLNDLNHGLPSQNGLLSQPERPKSKSPTTFLGENSNLVNLDNLVSARPTPVGMGDSITSKNYQNLNSLNNNNVNSFDPPTINSFGPSNNSFKPSNNVFDPTNAFGPAINGFAPSINGLAPPAYNGYEPSPTTGNSLVFNSGDSVINPFLGAPGETSSFISGVNPFNGPSPPNPFQAQQAPKPSLNQMRTRATASPSNSPWGPTDPAAALAHNDDPFAL